MKVHLIPDAPSCYELVATMPHELRRQQADTLDTEQFGPLLRIGKRVGEGHTHRTAWDRND